ncbi:hypothetical protein L6R50_01590 [Myxococcota bacterium]|nr:hypothetical protein [Myxococcota bacterium]
MSNDPNETGAAAGPRSPALRLIAWIPYAPLLWLLWEFSPRLFPLGLVTAAAVGLISERLFSSPTRHLWGAVVSFGLWFCFSVLWLYEAPAGMGLALIPAAAVAALWAGLRAAGMGRLFRMLPELSTVVFLLAAGLTGRAAISGDWLDLPLINEDALFAAFAPPEPAPLPADARKAAVDVVRKVLKEGDASAAPAAARPLGAGSGVSGSAKHPVYVFLFHPSMKATRGKAQGGSLGEALAEATADALARSGKAGEWMKLEPEVRIQIDIAGKAVPVHLEPDTRLSYKFKWEKEAGPLTRLSEARRYVAQTRPLYEVEPGVDGLILDAGEDHAEMTPSEPMLFGYLTPRVNGRDGSVEALLKKVSRDSGAGADAWLDESTRVQRFRTYSFGQPIPGGEVVELYRANVPLEGIDIPKLVSAIDVGGEWLLNTVKDDGTFLYEYLPNEDRYPKDYNWVRHAGAVYGLYHMYNLALREPDIRDDANRYLEAAGMAMEGVYRNLGTPAGAPADRVALIDRNRAESGSAALTLLTFIERPPAAEVTHPALKEWLYRDDDKRIMDGLALTMTDMIDGRGRVFRFYDEAMKLDAVKKEPPYFPGECQLALVRYYELTQDPRWLEGAKKISDYQVKRYDDGRGRRMPDHWVMQALHRVYKATGDEKYAKAAIRMGRFYAREQFPVVKPFFRDYPGSYRRDTEQPRTTRAASRGEALGGSVRSAWDLGRDADASAFEDALLWGAEHMVEQQFVEANSYYLPRPDRALGALRMGVADNDCRIDNNQHAAVGLSNALEVARKRAGLPLVQEPVLPPVPSPEEVERVKARLVAAKAAGEPAATAAGGKTPAVPNPKAVEAAERLGGSRGGGPTPAGGGG